MIGIARIYNFDPQDGALRVLIDGLWPRGIKKESIDVWVKSIAPSSELRKWYDHDADKWEEFRRQYREELDGNQDAVMELVDLCRKHKDIVLLYSTRAEPHNNATVLLEYLQEIDAG